MANKYIIQGATYCGNGTTSAEAASNGAAGSWNNINVVEGSAPAYGSLAAGDTVYIRSKTSAGADITRTIAANTSIGSASATAGSPITWVLDAGAIWSGISGVLQYTGSGSYYISVLANNNFIAEAQDSLVFNATSNWPGAEFIRVAGNIKNAKFISADTNTDLPILKNLGNTVELENANIQVARGIGGRIWATDGGVYRLINPSIEMTGTNTGQSVFKLDVTWGASQIDVFGGKIFGAGATSNTAVFNIVEPSGGYAAAKANIYGTSIPRAMPVSNYAFGKNGRIEMVGLDGGIGSHLEELWGWATSRTDNNPPVIEATLLDTNLTKWSWRIYPKAASHKIPAKVPSLKMFTDTAATKTVTLEFLLANTMSANKNNVWMSVQYTDNATGGPKSLSTKDLTAGALDTSTVGWSATTWGMITLLKKKLTVTTPTAIKQDTPIIVTFYCAATSASDQDILFVDSDFSLS